MDARFTITSAWELRFWQKVKPGNGCWEWIGARTDDGYGLCWWHYALRLAHRVVFELAFGEIPATLTVDHLCRNRACVNPYHLDVVTSRTNTLRGAGLAAQQTKQTHCKRGHEFTAENTYRKPGSPNKRDCRKCRALAAKNRTRNERSQF